MWGLSVFLGLFLFVLLLFGAIAACADALCVHRWSEPDGLGRRECLNCRRKM